MTLEQFGAVGVRTPYSFGRRVSGFGVSFVAGVAMFEWCVRRSLRAGTPPTPKIWNRGLTGLALGVCVCVCVCVCVWVWVGSHTNCTGVVGLRLERHSGRPQSTGLRKLRKLVYSWVRGFEGLSRFGVPGWVGGV